MTTNILKEVEYIDGNFPKETLLKAIEQKDGHHGERCHSSEGSYRRYSNRNKGWKLFIFIVANIVRKPFSSFPVLFEDERRNMFEMSKGSLS